MIRIIKNCKKNNTVKESVNENNMNIKIQNFVELAMKHQKEGNYKQAVKDFEEALKIKEDATLRSCLGSACLLSCDFENAIKNFQIAVDNKKELNSYDYIVSMLGIANAQILLDKYQDSFDTYMILLKEKSLSDIPEEKKIDFISGLAKAKWRTERYEDAINDFKAAIAIENRGYLHVGLSRVLVSMGNFEEAIKECLKAISLEDSSRTRVGLAEAKEYSGDLQGALKEYETALTKQFMGKTVYEVNLEKEHINNRIKMLRNRINNIN